MSAVLEPAGAVAPDPPPCPEVLCSDSSTSPLDRERLEERWRTYRDLHPDVLLRDTGRARAARALGVTEAELLAVECGNDVVRLSPDWPEAVASLPGLGRLKALTYTSGAVLETFGLFPAPEYVADTAHASSRSVQWTASLDRFEYGFACLDEAHRSLHFFDREGRGFHKLFLVGDGGARPFGRLVDRLCLEGATAGASVCPCPSGAPPAVLSRKDIGRLKKLWLGLSYPRGVAEAAELLETTRLEVLAHAPRDLARPVPGHGVLALLRLARDRVVPVQLTVRTPGVEHTYRGTIEELRESAAGLDVLDTDVHLHLATEAIDAAFVVSTGPGPATLELLDRRGDGILTVTSGVEDEAAAAKPERSGEAAAPWRDVLQTAIPDLRFSGRKAWPR